MDPPVGRGTTDEGGRGADGKEAAAAPGEVEGGHDVSAPPAQAGQGLLEGDGHVAMGIPAQDRFESDRDHGPVAGNGVDDGRADLFGRMGPGEALHQPCSRTPGPPGRR